MFDERVEEIVDKWDELLDCSEDFALWGIGDFDAELFRKTMYKTWEVFAAQIDFNVTEREYKLPLDCAILLGKMMVYANLKQITGREDDGDIELSAMIVNGFVSSVEFRNSFSQDLPVVQRKQIIDHALLKWTYNLKTGELTIENGATENDYIHTENGDLVKAPSPLSEPICTRDISRWFNI